MVAISLTSALFLYCLLIRLSGAAAAVSAASRKIGGEEMGAAGDVWSELREQRCDFFAGAPHAPVWRLSVPSTAPRLDLGPQLIEWGGAQRWLLGIQDADRIRALAEQHGGHATLFRGGDRQAEVFHPLAAPVAAIHRNLKAAFDPAGIFNPGRMYAEL